MAGLLGSRLWQEVLAFFAVIPSAAKGPCALRRVRSSDWSLFLGQGTRFFLLQQCKYFVVKLDLTSEIHHRMLVGRGEALCHFLASYTEVIGE